MEMHYKCSAEWHFSHLTGPGCQFASTLYSFAFHLSKKTGCFYASIPRLAEYFSVDEKTVRGAMQVLVKTGFLEVMERPSGTSVQYRVVPHNEWQNKHTGMCPERTNTTPWSEEPQDTLGKMLYAISGARFKPYPNFLKGMRKTGHSDGAIAEHFRAFLKSYKPTHPRAWAVGLCAQFMGHLEEQEVAPGQEQKNLAVVQPKYVGVGAAKLVITPTRKWEG